MKKVKQMKKICLSALGVTIAAALAFGGYAYYKYYKIPTSYIAIDINPSVEIGVSASGRVVTVTPDNADGETIVKGQNIINSSVSDAVSQLITSAARNNFIKNDGSTVISLTGISNNDKDAAQLVEVSEKAASSAVSANKLSAVYYKDTSDLSLKKQAEGSGISPGKYKLIKALESLDPNSTVENLKNSSVTDIMKELKKYVDNSNLETSQQGNSSLSAEELQKIAGLVNNQWKQVAHNSNNTKGKNGEKGKDEGTHSFNKDNICFEYNQLGVDVGNTFYVKIMTKTEDGKIHEFKGDCSYTFDTAYISFENGKFKALKEGKTVIKAVYNGNEAELNVSIGKQNDKNMLFFNVNDFTIGLNGSSYFQVVAVYNGEKKDVTASCDFYFDSSYLKVNAAQESFTGLKLGTTMVKASYKGMSATAKVNIINKQETSKDNKSSNGEDTSRLQNVQALARDYGVDIKGLPLDKAEQKVREAIAKWQGVDIKGLSPADADALLAKTKNNQMTAEGILFQNTAGLLGLNSNAITPVMKKEVGGKLGINFDGMSLQDETKAIQDALSKLGLKLP